MNRIGQSLDSWNELVIREGRLVSTRCSHWPGNRSGTRDDHGSAASSTCGVVRNFAITDFTFNAQVHIHCWKEHAIAEIKSCYTTRSKKRIELCIGHH